MRYFTLPSFQLVAIVIRIGKKDDLSSGRVYRYPDKVKKMSMFYLELFTEDSGYNVESAAQTLTPNLDFREDELLGTGRTSPPGLSSAVVACRSRQCAGFFGGSNVKKVG
jgi:hypothetical protein